MDFLEEKINKHKAKNSRNCVFCFRKRNGHTLSQQHTKQHQKHVKRLHMVFSGPTGNQNDDWPRNKRSPARSTSDLKGSITRKMWGAREFQFSHYHNENKQRIHVHGYVEHWNYSWNLVVNNGIKLNKWCFHSGIDCSSDWQHRFQKCGKDERCVFCIQLAKSPSFFAAFKTKPSFQLRVNHQRAIWLSKLARFVFLLNRLPANWGSNLVLTGRASLLVSIAGRGPSKEKQHLLRQFRPPPPLPPVPAFRPFPSLSPHVEIFDLRALLLAPRSREGGG